MLVSPLSASLIFNDAASLFHGSKASLNAKGRVQYIGARTHKDLGVFLKTLGKFFGELRLDEIHAGHIGTYQYNRANGIGYERTLGKGAKARTFTTYAGAAKINDELAVLRRLMLGALRTLPDGTFASAWTPDLQQLYMPLQEPECEIPKALTYEQQERFLATAAAIPECNVVWWYSLVALHTTFSSDEMRTLRQGDINLSQGILAVNRRFGKNRFRRREIPLTDGACLWALERLLERSITLGGSGPHLYLFPKRLVRNHYDANVPMGETGLRKAFHAARSAAGVPWFCINGWRHTAITRLAESGMPIAVIMRRAGHTSPKMSEHYTHISEQVERAEMMKMAQRKSPAPADIEDYRKRHAG